MIHRFSTRRTVAVLAVTGSLLAGGVVMATQSNADPITGWGGETYQVNGHLGTKAVFGGSGSWQRAWDECRKDRSYGPRVRSIKKYDNDALRDYYFCSSSSRP